MQTAESKADRVRIFKAWFVFMGAVKVLARWTLYF